MAWISIGVHLLAGLAMVLVLRLGLESNRDEIGRLQFLVRYAWLWQAGWFIWNLAALSILGFVVCFRRAHAAMQSVLLEYAVAICIAGVALDLAAEGIEMAVLPELARRALTGEEATSSFHAWHRGAVVLTGMLANGLYTISTVLLTWTTRHFYARWVIAAGLVVGLAGAALSAAVLWNSVFGMVAANVVLVPAILVWQVGVALQARREPSPHGDRRETPATR